MIRNLILLHFRNLWRNRAHASINILGLSLGITCSIVIFLILRFELTYDNFHSGADRIYRVVTEFRDTDGSGYSSAITYPLVPALRADFPDLEYVTLVDANHSSPVITIHGNGKSEKFKEPNIVFVDPEYFRMFKCDWIEGNNDALQTEKSVVITKSIAEKYFGKSSPINKVINYNNEFDLTVTGMIEDLPLNTDLAFEIYITSKLGNTVHGWTEWGAISSSINCFVKLNPGASQTALESKMDGWHMKYFTGEMQEEGKNRRYFLQPLEDVHFDTRFYNIGGRLVSYSSLTTMGLIGLLLLLTACVNFINLNTALITDRSKEAGIRKVLGSGQRQLVLQFLGETFTISLVAMLISAGFVELGTVHLTPILGYKLDFHPIDDLATISFLIILPLVVTVLAGLYPGVRLSKFQPVRALKSKMSMDSGSGINVRRSLIVFQLIISQVLVVCTIIVIEQLKHFSKQPIGLNSNSIVEFQLPHNKKESIHQLQERMKQIPGIENVTMTNTGATSLGEWSGDFEATVNDNLTKGHTAVKIVDEEFISTYQIQLIAGEDLVKSDTANRFLANEAFVKILGLKSPQEAIGVPVSMWGSKALISGVVKDFNTGSLHSKISPILISSGTGSYQMGAVRVASGDVNAALTKVQKVWEQVYPDYVYEQRFLDETIATFYNSERRISYLVGVLAGVAIFIGCIGLFGLVSFMARRKTKEVGIRKTLGASIAQIVSLFSKEFGILIAVSFAIAVPITYYFMEDWLSNFEYRIHPNAGTYGLGIILTIIVVMATVGIKAYKAAIANPVDALRDE